MMMRSKIKKKMRENKESERKNIRPSIDIYVLLLYKHVCISYLCNNTPASCSRWISLSSESIVTIIPITVRV